MTASSSPGPASSLLRHPLALAIAGSLVIAWSAILVRLADAPVPTSALLRCAYALPVLAALGTWQVRRHGGTTLDRRTTTWAVLAGACFAADLLLWHTSIAAVGAGLATVIANAQVVVIPLVAWAVMGERPRARQLGSIPALLVGTVLISGVLSSSAYGEDPLLGALTGLGTAVAYSGFLLCLRAASPADRLPVLPLTVATATACVPIALWGVATGGIELDIGWAAHGWLALLALGSQVVGWLLIGISLARLPAASVSLVLPVQPVASMLLAVAIFAEAPAPTQWLGVLVTLAGIVVAASAAPAPRTLDGAG